MMMKLCLLGAKSWTGGLFLLTIVFLHSQQGWAFHGTRLGSRRNWKSSQDNRYVFDLQADKGGKAEWSADSPDLTGGVNRPIKLDENLVSKLDETLGTFMTKAAIDTSSHYMLEFHNDIDQRWMKNFQNYSSNGFEAAGGWTEWLEKMISKDISVVQVLMNPPKALMRGRRAGMDNQVRLEYLHDVEPRKIAHQILSVRENVVAEMIQDLNCVKSENEEAMRYAQLRIEEGGELAEKNRKLTRMSETENSLSTPLRDRSYLECDIIITNFAIEQVRMNLAKQRDELGIVFLDDVLLDMQKKDDDRTVLERVLNEFYAPREFIETVCLKGLQQGVDRSSGLNALKIAESLLLARYAFALEANKILLDHDRHCRNYYKLIREKGGFQSWKSSTEKAKVRVVDLKAEEKIIASEEERRSIEEEQRLAAAKLKADLAAEEIEAARVQAALKAAEAESIASRQAVDDPQELGDFSQQGGPMLM